MSRKFDIFEVLNELDAGSVEYFTELTPEDKKTIPLFVVERWFSGCSDMFQNMYLNECVNPYMFSLGTAHPDLLWMLMCAGSGGKSRRYKWMKLPASAKNSESAKSVSEQVLKDMYHYSTARARDSMDLMTYDSVCVLAEYLGYPQEDMDTIAKEWGVAVKTKKKRTPKTQAVPVGDSTFDPMSAFEM